MARPKGQDFGGAQVDVVADTRTADIIMEGFLKAFDSQTVTSELLVGRVYPLLQGRARARFASEGDDVSGAWAELRPYTQKERAKGGFGPRGPINVRTGQLRSHVIDRPPDADPNTLGGTLWFPKRGGVGKAIEKVRVAQSGSKKPRTPPRPVLGVNEQDMELIMLQAAYHIEEFQRVNASGLFR